MTTIMTRSALIAWGQTPPPDVAGIISDRPGSRRVITWHEVMAQRRQRQHAQLAHKRAGRPRHAWRLMVAYYETAVFHGWQAVLDTYADRSVWIDRDRRGLRRQLMTVYPLVLPLGDPWLTWWPAWDQWKVAFAEQYTRRQQARKPLGVTYVWWDGAAEMSHIDLS